jgi:hypothetical protein
LRGTISWLAIPRRRLSGGTEGKTIIPANTILQQIGDILKAPVILAGVISRSAAMHSPGPQVTEEEEKGNAGDPAEGDDANPELISHILTQMAEFTVSMQKIQATSDATTARMQKIQATSDATTARRQKIQAAITATIGRFLGGAANGTQPPTARQGSGSQHLFLSKSLTSNLVSCVGRPLHMLGR